VGSQDRIFIKPDEKEGKLFMLNRKSKKLQNPQPTAVYSLLLDSIS
jgi:hypothetical protein